ncbi:hypothetical protein CHS0354_009755 [Potamilus streckersoni]|uniref:G2/mitotic-specific cyclin-B3 n=1 Tax=Potamilus streckersoni TaxID=2493646 RepID=A0AAE0SVK3_9BIVA|nr:hypothetical protein CHS0354_009755 [Potamilus streckersoni]
MMNVRRTKSQHKPHEPEQAQPNQVKSSTQIPIKIPTTSQNTLKATTASQVLVQVNNNNNNNNIIGKRQGDSLQDATQKRRAAFGDLTNACKDQNVVKDPLKKGKVIVKTGTTKVGKKKTVTAKSDGQEKVDVITDEKLTSLQGIIECSQKSVKSSEDSCGSQESLVSCSQESGNKDVNSSDQDQEDKKESEQKKPQAFDDVDKENLGDPVQVAVYAFDIFQYYKERELKFMVTPYLSKQTSLTSNMRAILVDWLVEVQENFELNHETLYLAVKLVDTYLSYKKIEKEHLQLVGAASVFISCKFDERCPPLVEDFLYICDDAYKRREFLTMERTILKTIGFDIGMPLSYRFLRRYAKCARATIETLTLARFVLEMSLMEYNFITYRDSELAAGALMLTLKMNDTDDWTPTLSYYTGYERSHILPIAKALNAYIALPPKQLTTIRSKYSHKVFYEVAKTQPLPDSAFD